jgi:lipopolysaccharide transport system permease protein
LSGKLEHPGAAIGSFWRHRALILQLVKREVVGRYSGSFFGVVWSFINPLLMLTIYTFVFGVVFKSRWRPTSSDPMEFAVVMFAGVMLHSFIAECLTRAPVLIVGNVNFVKKVVFPLEIFAWVAVGTALFHMLIAMLILGAAILIWQGHLLWSLILVPVLILPFALATVGLVWFISSLGVYLRDIGQLMGIMSSLLIFLAPVFYPLHSVPAGLADYLYLNPITFVLEQVRNAAVWGTGVDWAGWGLYCVVAYVVAWLGFTWFQRMRGGFADVL